MLTNSNRVLSGYPGRNSNCVTQYNTSLGKCNPPQGDCKFHFGGMKVVSRPPGDWSVTADWDDGHVSVVQVWRTAPTARRSVDYPAFGRPIRFRLSKSALADPPPGDWCGTPHRNDRTRLRGVSRLSPTLPPGGRQPTYFETCNRPVPIHMIFDSDRFRRYNSLRREWCSTT